MKKLSFLIGILLLSTATTMHTERIKVTGIVTDESLLPIPGANVIEKGTTNGTVTDVNGEFEITVNSSQSTIVVSFIGYTTKEIKVGSKKYLKVRMNQDVQQLSEVVVTSVGTTRKSKRDRKSMGAPVMAEEAEANWGYHAYDQDATQDWNTEEYATIHDNIFRESFKNPLSTFSIDVDAASYSNMRRFLNNGQAPPKDAVRIEEMVNYFTYEYPQPKDDHPFSIITEISEAPWNTKHKLVHIGLQGKTIPTENLPASNLVFLLDVSGSMNSANKLPLLKKAFTMLVDQLRPQDRVAIVVYAGAAGVVLPSTAGSQKQTMKEALNNLSAGGSTAGGAGISLAYKIAQENFIEGGNNRVILATDGDFNIGESSNAAMERLIEGKREAGVFLTVLGFGMGNYKDSKMEILADKGNGNYAYIDNILEARKVLINEFGGTLFTIAKDVKIQVEFNPAHVRAYRLIGYENRMLKSEDFNDDKKDAGELGSGHTVTALYEIIPSDITDSPYVKNVDDLKYQKQQLDPKAFTTEEIMYVKLRYKKPDGNTSRLIEMPLKGKGKDLDRTSDNFRWSAAVASFGMLLRDSEFKGSSSYDMVLELARGAKGKDDEGYRAEFIRLVKSGQLMASK